jgi:GTP-binding protein Era
MQKKTKAGYVAIIGKPNAGKSTFMNNIVGAKLSIVTPKPQTTRKKVLGIFTENDLQIVFLDTPGILKPDYKMHHSMMGYVTDSVNEADCILVLIDLEKYKSFDTYFNKGFLSYFTNINKPKVVLLNKIDTFKDAKAVLPIIAEIAAKNLFDEIIPISAIKQDIKDSIIGVIAKYIPENPYFYNEDELSTLPQRFFVSELVREEVFLNLKQEIPYSTDVSIIEFKERKNGKWYISAEIIVERQSQKKIVVGAKGESLKKIGSYARAKIETHLGTEVFLELFVKVREDWRSKDSMLKSLGY